MGHDKPELKRRTGTETGVIQRVEIRPEAAHEPPQPPTLPEFDSGGITGMMPLKAEGEDAAKQRDDTTSINVSSQ
ncbi:MAG: hypothetical protein LCI00_25725 [Chloroflexi bacterium]|nr:hypothetical protein [Chloroflexota bacterium]MCC6895375.1 hypothetical protein [Anaerolineae bacterium]